MIRTAGGDGDDTIVAIATPPGVGAVGLIRVSGPRAWKCVDPLVRRDPNSDISPVPRRVRRVRVNDPDARFELDDALLTFMPGPHSYTGEDVVELSCHGNPVVLWAVVESIIGQGARLAEPGEFTRRAYLNGRMDLVQAEAVALLIEARTSRAARLALRQVQGDLSGVIATVRRGILDLIAELEVALDFPEEEYGASSESVRATGEELCERLSKLIDSARHGQVAYRGLSVVIAGAPNVGKSSLLNALLGRERAIVSSTPGTTRDLVEGALVIDGVEVRLVDGAGIGTPRDRVDAEGMARSREAIAESDLVVVLLDSGRSLGAADDEVLRLTHGRPRLIAASKRDLVRILDYPVDCECSTVEVSGTGALLGRLAEWVHGRTGDDAEEGGIVAPLRVMEALEAARCAITRALNGMATRMPAEATLVDLGEAQDLLDRLVGGTSNDQVLDRIFSRFCVGK